MQLNRISRTFIYEAFHENKQQDKGKKQNNSKEFKIKGSSKIRIGFIFFKKKAAGGYQSYHSIRGKKRNHRVLNCLKKVIGKTLS